MVVYVANPLYDSVFKYLMEDERIAKTILTALLKKKVVDVKIRRNEPKSSSMAISLCRIKLQVAIQEDTNQVPESIIVEIEKTWLMTQTLSKRQHVAEQYNIQANSACHPNDKEPMTDLKIYILAHCIGSINLPILYVRKHIVSDFDFQDHPAFTSEPFIKSLPQDSIIIQLPLLNDKPKHRHEKILSLFCQSHLCPADKQLLAIEEDCYQGDEELGYMIYRLQAAACNPDMRSQMDTEDLYLPVLESKDTQLMELDHQLGRQTL